MFEKICNEVTVIRNEFIEELCMEILFDGGYIDGDTVGKADWRECCLVLVMAEEGLGEAFVALVPGGLYSIPMGIENSQSL